MADYFRLTTVRISDLAWNSHFMPLATIMAQMYPSKDLRQADFFSMFSKVSFRIGLTENDLRPYEQITCKTRKNPTQAFRSGQLSPARTWVTTCGGVGLNGREVLFEQLRIKLLVGGHHRLK
jgi:hypothetical protein